MVEMVKMPRVKMGKIVSDKMDKTIVVQIEHTIKHYKYGKILTKRSKVQAHDPDQVGKIGDTVRICQTKPISKNKSWKLIEVVSV